MTSWEASTITDFELIDFLGSIHIGVPLFITEKHAFLPNSAPSILVDLVQRMCRVDVILVADTIIGTLVAGNSSGLVVSNVVSKEVLNQLENIDLPIYQPPEYFAFGNVVLANDYGGIISPVVPSSIRNKISETLNIPLEPHTIGDSDLVGSLARVTNYGGLFTPLASEDEIARMKELLHLKETGVSSVNKGSEFVASGVVGNTKGVLMGNATTGIEIMQISRIFTP